MNLYKSFQSALKENNVKFVAVVSTFSAIIFWIFYSYEGSIPGNVISFFMGYEASLIQGLSLLFLIRILLVEPIIFVLILDVVFNKILKDKRVGFRQFLYIFVAMILIMYASNSIFDIILIVGPVKLIPAVLAFFWIIFEGCLAD